MQHKVYGCCKNAKSRTIFPTCDNDGDRVGLPPRRLAGERVGVFRLDVVEAHPELPVAVHVAHEPA